MVLNENLTGRTLKGFFQGVDKDLINSKDDAEWTISEVLDSNDKPLDVLNRLRLF